MIERKPLDYETPKPRRLPEWAEWALAFALAWVALLAFGLLLLWLIFGK